MANLNKNIVELDGLDKQFSLKLEDGTVGAGPRTLAQWCCQQLLANQPKMTSAQKLKNFLLSKKIFDASLPDAEAISLTEDDISTLMTQVVDVTAPLIAGQILQEIS